MKYVLVDNDDNVVDRVDLGSEVGISGARTFFIGRKQIPYENFIQLWKVMTEESYQLQLKLSLKNRQIEWWNDDDYLDIDR
jgi:hypothetical protein